MERLVLAALALLCAACNAQEPTRSSVESVESVESVQPVEPVPPPSPVPPASGPLSIDAFPAPERLGEGWSYRVDPGDPEAGFTGNGTPGHERDPAEVATLAVPLGCERPALPVAQHAFEVDYTLRTRPVVLIRMAFDTDATARRFIGVRLAALRACVGRGGGSAVGPLVSRVRRIGPAVLSDRTPDSEPWTEVALRRGADVLMLASAAALGPDDVRHLVRVLESS